MLEGLDNVPWDTLQDCYGRSNEIPQLIHALISRDEATRQSALDDLRDLLVHQDTVFEATSYAVPFLIELLGYEATPSKHDIVYLLSAVGDDVQVWDEIWGDKRGSVTKANDQQLTEEITGSDHMADARRARQEVLKGIDLYLHLLESGDSDIRKALAYLLDNLPEVSERTIPALRRAIDTEHDEIVKAHLIDALRNLTSTH